ncbi:hypothetical protein LOAG_06634 [Loa loa]|uniref:Uncharacterized protein n=1 Tax=Loa loa TaxID=7209 RepID=A0A1S0TXJ3_LOALO|nr:hypothetical protein LOAG_06634 [Loa loa]EFO21853.1 hypothetical protein LOAG_06634 [Loa loa]
MAGALEHFQRLSVKWLTLNGHLKFKLPMSSPAEFIQFSSCIFDMSFELLNSNPRLLSAALTSGFKCSPMDDSIIENSAFTLLNTSLIVLYMTSVAPKY